MNVTFIVGTSSFVLKFVLFPFVGVFQEDLGRGEGQRKEKNSRSH